MGGCRRRGRVGGVDMMGYDYYLHHLNNAPEPVLQKIPALIAAGRTDEILLHIQNHPGLLQQVIPSTNGSNLIIASLYEIMRNTPDNSATIKQNNLVRLLNTIIAEHADKIDLKNVDNDGNTALHRSCWYACTTGSASKSMALRQIATKLLERIADSTAFRRLISKKNIYNQTFLQNIFFTGSLSHISSTEPYKSNIEALQASIAPLIDPFRVTSAALGTSYDFENKSFKVYLEELLQDPVSFDIITEPHTSPLGHTFSAETWAGCDYKCPLTRSDYQQADLKANDILQLVINAFCRHSDTEEDLLPAIKAALPDHEADPFSAFNKDIILEKVTDLVQKYEAHLGACLDDAHPAETRTREAEAEVDSPINDTPDLQTKTKVLELIEKLRLNIINKENGRASWFKVGVNDKIKQLLDIYNFVDQHDVALTKEQLEKSLGLIKTVVAIKRNPVGFHKPHSLDEFYQGLEKDFSEINIDELPTYSLDALKKLTGPATE